MMTPKLAGLMLAMRRLSRSRSALLTIFLLTLMVFENGISTR